MPFDANGNYVTDDELREQEEAAASGGSGSGDTREYNASGDVIKNYLTPDEAQEQGVEWMGRPNEPLPYRTEDEIAGTSTPYDYRPGYDDDPNRTWIPEAQWYSMVGNYDYSPANGNPSASGGSGDGIDSWLGGSGSGSGSLGGVAGGGSWGSAANMFPDWYRQLMERQQAQGEERAQMYDERGNALWQTLQERAGQGLDVSRSDPAVRAQADAYAANQRRAQRNYLSDTAEKAGPYANLQGEQRMAAERYGAATGMFEAELIGREIAARRQEIQSALQQAVAMNNTDQVRQLQMVLAQMDAAAREAGFGVQMRGQDIGMDQFLRDLALRESFGWDDRNYRNIYG